MAEEIIDYGRIVLCDDCGTDYTNRDDVGGLLFQSKALCPDCVPQRERQIAKYHEERFVKARCPLGLPFRVWVLQLRGGDNRVRILTGDDAIAALDRSTRRNPRRPR